MNLKKYHFIVLTIAASISICPSNSANAQNKIMPDADNAGLKLPAGFGALIAADNIGKSRHIAVAKNGDLYVKIFHPAKGSHASVLKLHDKNGDGKFDETMHFGKEGWGSEVLLKDGYLYTSSDTAVYRYKLDINQNVIDTAHAERLVYGLKVANQHETKSFTIDNAGNLYVNIGAYSNSCQVNDRQKGSPGKKDCPVLQDAAGVWQFKINKQNQTYQDGVHYATGLRNIMGLDWNQQTNSLFVMQHGRDQLDMFPQYFDAKASAELPAECMYQLKQGDNAGWPYIYFDPIQKKKMLAPEYGGDGKIEGNKEFINPVAFYPAHMAPNALMFYTGNMFPDKYKNGAFIAFHGSWNRSPLPQAGYFVVFQPFKNGKPSGDWEVFADGFSGKDVITSTRQAEHRPCGLAQGSDGSLYVSDDAKGRIYRIVYKKQ